MLNKSTYFDFPIHPFCSLFHQFCFPKLPFLHTVIKLQAKIRESNEQGCICIKPPTCDRNISGSGATTLEDFMHFICIVFEV